MNSIRLTEEQKRRIEENKQRALALRTEKQSPVKSTGNSLSLQTSSVKSNNNQKDTRSSQLVNSNINKIISKTASSEVQNNSASASTNNWNSQSHFSGIPNLARPHQVMSKPALTKLCGKCVFIGNNAFSVEIGYNAELVQFFKQLKTRNYDASTKLWSFKLEEYDKFIKGVHSFRPEIEIEGLPPWILQIFSPSKSDVDVVPQADLSLVDNKLVHALLPFQRDGVNLAIHRNGRLLIADDMGLGKTLQAICIACFYRKEWPLLIVSPSSVRFDWAQQICKWLPTVAPCDINVVETGKADATLGMINIVSYDLVSKKADELKKKMFRVVIMDESHFLKNGKTVRTKAAMPLLKNANRVILLSGTPALSRPIELFSQIIAVYPNLFKFHDFGLRYCNAKKMQWGWDYSSSSNMVELQALLENRVMIRRQKKDVLSQLPAKYRQVIMLDPSSVHKHKDLNVASKIMSNSKLKGLNKQGALLEYFHETCKAKLSAVRDYVLDLTESEKKFLVFAHHKDMLDCIEDGIRSKASNTEYIRIDGRTSSEQRNFFCSKFQTSDNYKVAILSITAANAGLNLSAANIVVFAELFWNPGILVQAEDRAHRIGQQDSVSVQYLVAQNTADDYIWPLVQGKLNILSKAGLTKDDFTDTDTKHLSNDTQLTLLEMFNKEFMDNTVPDIVVTDDSTNPEITVTVEGMSPEKVDVNVISLSPVNVKINVVAEETKKMAYKPRSPKKSASMDWTRKVATQQSIMRSQTSTASQGDKTLPKRQASITNFFERTPPKKLCLDEGLATQQSSGCESIAKKKLYIYNANLTAQQPDVSKCAGKKIPEADVNEMLLDQDDDFNDVIPWLDDDFSEDCVSNNTNMVLSLSRSDESGNPPSQDSKTGSTKSPDVPSQDIKTGGDLSPHVTSQDSILEGAMFPLVTSQDSIPEADVSPHVTSQESRGSNSTATQDILPWLQDLDWDDEL